MTMAQRISCATSPALAKESWTKPLPGSSAMALDVAVIINFFLDPMTLFPA
jgi:hypothetical protein